MYNKKHMAVQKSKIKYILIIALIITIFLIIKSVYNIQVTTIKNVDKATYFSFEEDLNKTGNVIIKYVNSEGNEIAESQTITGKVGEEYNTTRKNIDGYKPYGNDPINKIGNYSDLDINVIYMFEKIGNEVTATTNGNIVTVQVIKNKEAASKEVKFSIITENENGEKIKGAKYIVTNNSSAVIRNSIAYAEKLIIGSLTINEEGTDTYYIKELSAPKGYQNITDRIGVNITKTYVEDQNSYNIVANLIDSNSNVDIQFDENNNEIILIIKNAKKSEEDHPTDQKFDLSINKSIEEVKLVVNGKEQIKQKDGDKLLKIDIPKSKVDSSSIEVTYRIEVKNVGDIPGYVTEITDVLPDDMEVIESNNWVVNNKNAISNIFERDIINPGESVITYIKCNLKLNKENIGMKTNKAIISGYYNDYGIADSTPNNEFEEPLLITIKTGGKVLITIETVIALFIIIAIIYTIKKEQKNEIK